MNHQKIRETINRLSEEIKSLKDPKAIIICDTLIEIIEFLLAENDELRKTIQLLRDEIAELKKEQRKPKIRPQTGLNNHSSEEERKESEPTKTRKFKLKKKGNLTIHRTEIREQDKATLPDDVVFKGYTHTVIQDVKFQSDNVEFKRAVYYSPSLKKTFTAPLPAGYEGEFGPVLRTMIPMLFHESEMTESAIKRFLNTFGVQISAATISRLLTDNQDILHQEKEAIIDAGLKSTLYQHLDDTSSRVKGKNHHTHILCNPFYTAYFTTEKKDRLSLLNFLSRGELHYTLNSEAYEVMISLGLADKKQFIFNAMGEEKTLTKEGITAWLATLFPNPKKNKGTRRMIMEAAALVYYHSLPHALKFLMVDNAPQFNLIAAYKGLCWIHEGRHYNKLIPMFEQNRFLLKDFKTQFWGFYKKLLAYKKTPTPGFANTLSKEFDTIFSTKTGYDALDQRIQKTRANKDSLLLVLTSSFLPLHNNSAELGARVQARKRDIHLHTNSEKGTQAKDTFATIVQTARKCCVNVFDYLFDRISKKREMPSLASIVLLQANVLATSA